MTRRIGGKHPLAIQPLVVQREGVVVRIQATPLSQHPVEFLSTQDEIEASPLLVEVLRRYASRPPLGRVRHVGMFDLIADALDVDVQPWLEQPDRSEVWMIAELLHRQICPGDQVVPLLTDFQNLFFVGNYAVEFTWLPRRKLFRGDIMERKDRVYLTGSRFLQPVPEPRPV